MALPDPARAWDRTLSQPLAATPGDFTVEYFTEPDSGGFWALGYGLGESVYQEALVRYDASGNPQFVRYPQDSDAIVGGPVALADGGLAVEYAALEPGFAYPDMRCYAQRFDSNGVTRWRRQTGHVSGFVVGCGGELRADGANGVWLYTQNEDSGETLQRLGVDGVATDSTLLGLPTPDTTTSDAYVIGPPRLTIGRHALTGEPRWQWTSPGGGGVIRKLIVAADGNLYGFGLAAGAQAGYAVSLTRDGSLRWETTFSNMPVGDIESAAVAADGSSYVVTTFADSSGIAIRLLRLDANGNSAWPDAFAPEPPCSALVNTGKVVAAPDGEALFLHAPSYYCNQTSKLFRVRRDGTQRYAVAASANPYAALLQIGSLEDGSTLLVDDGTFRRLDADGATLAAPRTAGLLNGLASTVERAIDADGNWYVLARADSHLELTRLAADGTTRWHRNLDGADARLAPGADRVCIAGALGVESPAAHDERIVCLDAASGAIVWDTQVAGASSGVEPVTLAARALDSGKVIAVYGRPGSVEWRTVSVDASGAIEHDVVATASGAQAPSVAAIDASGAATIVQADPAAATAVAPDGTVRFSTTLASLDLRALLQLQPIDDGTTLLTALVATSTSAPRDLFALRLDANGHVLWKTAAGAGPEGVDGGTSSVAGGRVFLAPSDGRRVFALALADGAHLWDTPLPSALRYPLSEYALASLVADPAGERVLALAPHDTKIGLTVLDAATGAVSSDRFEPCLAAYCAPATASLDAAGALRVAGQFADESSGIQERLYVLEQPFAAADAIALDQPGIAGAWYPTYAGGQGFTLDYIAASRTIFMPYFTFAPDPGPLVDGPISTSRLTWYALQGDVAPGATFADLAIAQTEPGTFASGSVDGKIVGSAQLAVRDCDNATLYYQFDANTNGGAGGLISLTRLTPSTEPCMLGDGSIVPAQNTNPPANGFDARQSGSWYDPSTGGQGLQITIIPAGAGDAGLVFAAWFTFDPAGLADDADHQHWFTLQGGLSAATDAAVVLPIYRIIGGALDGAATNDAVRVGTATLTMQGCDAAQLDYAFDASEVAHAFAGLTGSMHLIKIGGCSTR